MCGPKILAVPSLDKDAIEVVEEAVPASTTVEPAEPAVEEVEEEEEETPEIIIQLKANEDPCTEDIDCAADDAQCVPYTIEDTRNGSTTRMGGKYCLTEAQAGCDNGEDVGTMYEEEKDGVKSKIISKCEVFCADQFCYW